MESIIEFTMHAKPGRYADVLAAYSEFAQAFQEAVPADRLILITGDPASGLIRGIGVFTEKQIAADVYSMPFFAKFNDSISDLITETPERTELDLIHLYQVQAKIDSSSLVWRQFVITIEFIKNRAKVNVFT